MVESKNRRLESRRLDVEDGGGLDGQSRSDEGIGPDQTYEQPRSDEGREKADKC